MARSNLLSHAFVWAQYVYIYMGKIWEFSSKDYDPVELKLDEDHQGA